MIFLLVVNFQLNRKFSQRRTVKKVMSECAKFRCWQRWRRTKRRGSRIFPTPTLFGSRHRCPHRNFAKLFLQCTRSMDHFHVTSSDRKHVLSKRKLIILETFQNGYINYLFTGNTILFSKRMPMFYRYYYKTSFHETSFTTKRPSYQTSFHITSFHGRFVSMDVL
jgi:hypothetical protein